jgi:nitrate reductase NapE
MSGASAEETAARKETTAMRSIGSQQAGLDAADEGFAMAAGGHAALRRRELFMFLFLAVIIWPFIAVAVVGGYGFLVWMYRIFTGPPGPV